MISVFGVYLEYIVAGVWVTAAVSLAGCIVALLVSFAVGIVRVLAPAPVRWIAAAYVEIFRGTSFIVQLFWIYFTLPLLGITLPAFPVAVVVLGLNVGSFGSEVVRGAVLGVPRTLTEAAIALNYGKWQRFRRVILPNALPMMVLPFANLAVDLLKTSSVVSLISLTEITFRAQVVRAQIGETFAPFLMLMLIYYVLATAIEWAAAPVERLITRHRQSYEAR
jgi:polar amino acid transport system permease protein